MKTARLVFMFAGIYGLIVTVPLFFLEGALDAMQPPAITHPEYYYGFAWVVLIWQVLFLVIARDPVRYRPMMLLAILEKVAGVIFILLVLLHRSPTAMLIGVADVVLGVLFWVAYSTTAPASATQAKAAQVVR